MAKEIIYTIGHSTLPIEKFISLLTDHKIELLADIRTIPRSHHNPQFNKDSLPAAIAPIEYRHLKALGGLRKPRPDSPNTAWQNASFQGYADYTLTDEFIQALDELIMLASTLRTAIMCAEALPWRCHRSIVADELLLRKIDVTHIFPASRDKKHEMTEFARRVKGKLIYPDQP